MSSETSFSDIPSSIIPLSVITLADSLAFGSFKNICFIDSAVETDSNFSQFLNTDTYPVIYDYNSDREALKTALLQKFTRIDRVSFVFHGPPDQSSYTTPKLFMSNQYFFAPGTDDTGNFLQSLFTSLQVQNVDFLACNLLQHQEWQDYFASFTDVVVGASLDATGNVKYGGNWVMENTMENIRDLYFKPEIENFATLLETYLYTDTVNNKSYTFTFTISGTTATLISPCAAGAVGSIIIPQTVVSGGNSYTVTNIGTSAFENVTGIVSVVIPDSVLSIGIRAFATTGLTGAIIPNSVTSIGGFAYAWTPITSIAIPNSVTSIGEFALALTKLTIVVIPNSVLTIAKGIFYGCGFLTRCTISNSLKTLPQDAFSNCLVLETIAIPSSVTSIGQSAYYNCARCTSVYYAGSTLPTFSLLGNNLVNANLFSYYLNTAASPNNLLLAQTFKANSNIPISASEMVTKMLTSGYSSQYTIDAFIIPKVQPFISVRPAVSASITYPATIGSATLSGGSALSASVSGTAVPGIFSIYSSISSSVYNAGTYIDVSATFVPIDTALYLSISTTIPTITVLKATPYITSSPIPATIIFPNKLNTVVITGGLCTVSNGGATLDGTFAIRPDLSNSVYAVGTYQNVPVIFTPSDSLNYNSVATTIQTLTVTQVSNSQLQSLGIPIADLIKAGYTATDLRTATTDTGTAGFTLTELIGANFTISQLKEAKFTPSELIAAGVSTSSLYDSFTTLAEKKSVTRSVVSNLLTPTSPRASVPLATLVGYSFQPSVTSVIAVKVTDVNTPITVNKSELAGSVSAVYAVLEVVSSYVVLPTWFSTIRVMCLGNEFYRVYDSNGTTVLDDNLVTGDTRTYNGLTVVIGSVTATLAIQPNIDFVLSGLNSVITLSKSGELPNYHPSLTTDATITLSTAVQASVLQNTFFFRTDNPITLDASFVYHYVDTTKWANQSTTLSPRNGLVTSKGYASNDTGGKDFLRDLARQLFGTYLAADLFTNETAVIEDINTKFDTVATNIMSILTSIDISNGSPIVMPTDEFGKKYLKDDTATTNISRELLNELISSAPTRFADIKTNYLYNSVEDGYYKIPILPGDTISFEVIVFPAAGQMTMVPTGKTSLTPRSYTVLLNVVL